MARVVIELFGVPRLRAGVGRLEVEAARLDEALAALARACPALEGPVIGAEGRLHPAYRVSLDSARLLDDPATPLDEWANLLLLAADAGG